MNALALMLALLVQAADRGTQITGPLQITGDGIVSTEIELPGRDTGNSITIRVANDQPDQYVIVLPRKKPPVGGAYVPACSLAADGVTMTCLWVSFPRQITVPAQTIQIR